MEDEDTVEPQVFEQVDLEQEVPEENMAPEPIEDRETKVPLSALQKERKKRQELEQELQWERKRQQMAPPPPQEEDNSRYESATREELARAQEESLRIFEERQWIKNNPEKFEKVNEHLPQFLKQRPNLASAINTSVNRYEEAYTLMEALTPKQQQQLRTAPTPKKEAPGAPTSIPKSAALNQTVDVMSMSDSEFTVWRNSQKKRR